MTITEEAKGFIEQMMKEAGVSTLRIAYVESGCCGPSYQLELDKPHDDDTVSLVNGVQVAVDPRVADQVSGLTLGFIQDEQGAALTISGGSSSCC